ncbi:hypothetical protein HPB52_001326 [Rhipicephalus sanguineus]|uniref:Endonuclease/exonuclease/phosphatase domain-containing protein n=1 Tax=Rhipicephalus sanguineus TaxID=34632 RepID=A0A9D4SRC1_RHISA|nr:hypothetical protein HPB52_001326 [Rhipicephalus sanguineus]
MFLKGHKTTNRHSPAPPCFCSVDNSHLALQRQNAELRRHTKNLAKKIRELEAKLARLTEPQAHGGPSEPMQQTEPVNLDDRASVASDLSTYSQCTGSTSIGHVPIMEHRLENLERTIADMPGKILEGVRASFRELWQRELPHMVESITPAVTDSVLSIVQGRTGVQLRNSRSRSRSPRPDTRRRPVVSRQIIGSQEHIAAASSPETLPQRKANNKIVEEKFEIVQWNCRGFRNCKKRSHLQLYLQSLGTPPAILALQEPGSEAKFTGYSSFQGGPTTCILVNKAYTAVAVDLDLDNEQEHSVVKVLPLKRRDPAIHILNIYCPPHKPRVTFNEIFYRALKSAGKEPLVIVGDFNAPSLHWGYHFEKARGRKLAELISTLRLTLLTDPASPTRLGIR